jgi:protoporphyrinogen/coproporphyrinogen III oxidase
MHTCNAKRNDATHARSDLSPHVASPSHPIAIVGGGITGLTAAVRLRQHGHPVTLYEASPRLGGVIQSLEQDGYLAEFGPNTILETSPKIVSLVHDLKLDSRRLYSDPAAANRYIVRRRRPVALPTSPIGFLTTPLFSLSAKLRLLREPFLPPSPPDIEESLAQFVLRRLGREFLDYAINPFVGGVYAGDPGQISVREAFPKLLALEQKYGSLIKGQILGARERRNRAEVSKQSAPKFSFQHGLQELIDALQNRLGESIQPQSQVIRLQANPAGWRVTTRVQQQLHEFQHSAVLLAIPAHQLPQIQVLASHPVDLQGFSQIHYPPVASVVLGFRRKDVPHPLDGFGMLVPQIEGFRILGTIFSSSLFPHRAPPNHVTLTSYVGGTRAPDLALRPVRELIQLTLDDLRSILGIVGQPTFTHCVLYPKAIPQYNIGYGRFRQAMADIETRAPGLFLAGHSRDGVSLGDSIVSGHDVAARIHSLLNPSDPKLLRPEGLRSHPVA